MGRKSHRERGEGRIGLIVALLIAGVAIFLGLRIIPLKIKLFEFSDKIEQKLQRASWRSYDQAKVETMKFVREQAAYTGYPVDHLKVAMPPPVTGEMVVVVDWDIPLDLAVTQYTWKYHLEKRAPMIGRGGPSF
jgi:hypothetical protein